MKRLLSALLVLALLAPITAQAQAVNAVYVSPSGADTNGCTLAAPCLTLQRAWSVAQPGYTVYMRGGYYLPLAPISLSGKNTITITAYPGEWPVIDGVLVGNIAPTQSLLEISNGRDISLSLIEIRNSKGRGLSFREITNGSVFRARIHNVGERCLGISGQHISVDQSHAWLCAQNWISSTASGGWPAAISTWYRSDGVTQSDHITIANTTANDTPGEGIICLHVIYCNVLGGAVYDVKSVAVYVDDAQYSTVDGVYIFMSDPRYKKNGTRLAHGVMIGNENGTRPSAYITVTNNIMYDVYNGVYLFCYLSATCSYNNVVVSNNRIVGSNYAFRTEAFNSVSGVNTYSFNTTDGPVSFANAGLWSIIGNVAYNMGTLTATPTSTVTPTPTQTMTPTRTPTPTPIATLLCAGRLVVTGNLAECFG